MKPLLRLKEITVFLFTIFIMILQIGSWIFLIKSKTENIKPKTRANNTSVKPILFLFIVVDAKEIMKARLNVIR